MDQFNRLPPIDYFSQLIHYRKSQLDVYYRYLIELQHFQQQNLQHQFQRHLDAAKAMTQFNEEFDRNFPQFKMYDDIVGTHRSSVGQQVLDPTVNHVLENVEIESGLHEEETPQDLFKCQILSLKCIFSPHCSEAFSNKTKLDLHMQVDHKMAQYRCLLRNCGQSFSTSQMLNHHFQTAHPLLSNWNCGRCVRTYQSHTHLNYHHRNYHQSGKFACSSPDCTFIGQYRSDVYTHYEQRHQTYRCDQPECGKSFRKTVHLKTHQRIHLGIKPYKCKWTDCLYASEDRSNVIKHIRIMHFKLPITKKEQKSKKIVDHRNPKQYLEVVKSLL